MIGHPGFGDSIATGNELGVTNRRKVTGGPSAYAIGGAFPNSLFRRDSPSAVFWAAEIARRLRAALDEQSVVQVANAAGVGRQTIYDVVRGKTWPDMVTIIRLQDCLGVSLWPEWAPGSQPDGHVADDAASTDGHAAEETPTEPPMPVEADAEV